MSDQDFGTPIPVQVARQIGLQFAKSPVLILAVDNASTAIHSVSWGMSALDKIIAKVWSETAVAAVGGDLSQRRNYENFATRSAAEAAETIERLMLERDELKQQLATLRDELLVREGRDHVE